MSNDYFVRSATLVLWVALNASADGRPLYEALGYDESPSPMMVLSLGEPRGRA